MLENFNIELNKLRIFIKVLENFEKFHETLEIPYEV